MVFCTVFFSIQTSPEILVHKFGVAAVRGVTRNKNITEFQLKPQIRNQQVVDGIIAQLTSELKRKLRVAQDQDGCPFIELCPVGEW